jgi:transcriptional regulator GlxA family with amidase domain
MKHFGEVAFSSGKGGVGCQRLAFLLLGGFTHLAFACAVEPLRLANLASGLTLFNWRTLSFDGRPAKSSSGIRVEVDGGVSLLDKGETLVVVGGLPTVQSEKERVIVRLRHEKAHGRQLMALCGGVTVIAEAGLADDMNCAVHWQVAPAFSEKFPRAQISLACFEMGKIPTASGGTAAADLMLAMIRDRHGDDLCRKVADLMVHHAIRDQTGPQTSSLMYHIPGRNAKLATIIQLMEGSIDAPLGAEELAGAAGVSVRQMERLFRRYLATSPKRHYQMLRLNRAKDLLVQSNLSITEIAMATGFAAVSHFSKCFRAQFGVSPYGSRTSVLA